MTADKETVTCPICGKEDTWRQDNESRPFCSARCKLIDLGEWAEGRAIPGNSADNPEGESEHLPDDDSDIDSQ